MFYLLFFCIFFDNNDIFQFLRVLIIKMPEVHDMIISGQIHTLTEMIDMHGIELLRQQGEKPNRIIYHMALYNAFDDSLRVIYRELIRKMSFISLRNEDSY